MKVVMREDKIRLQRYKDPLFNENPVMHRINVAGGKSDEKKKKKGIFKLLRR